MFLIFSSFFESLFCVYHTSSEHTGRPGSRGVEAPPEVSRCGPQAINAALDLQDLGVGDVEFLPGPLERNSNRCCVPTQVHCRPAGMQFFHITLLQIPVMRRTSLEQGL